MSKEERKLIENLNNKMPEFTGTPEEVEKKIAMYLYLELGKIKVFDEEFFLGNHKERKKIARTAEFNVKYNMDKIVTKRKLVCISIAALYKRVLKAFGIKSTYVQMDEHDDHVTNVITLSSGKKIMADLQKDLDRIQTYSKTQYFGQGYERGAALKERIGEDELFEMQKECGYVKTKEDYKDEKVAKLAKQVEGLKPNEILKNIIYNEDINNYQSNIGYIELFKYYSCVIYNVAKKYIRNGIDYCNCYRKVIINGEEKKQYSMCIYSVYDDKIEVYMYSKADGRFNPISIEELKEMERHGLFIGKDQQEKGVKVLRRYINKSIEDRIKNKSMQKDEAGMQR